MKRPSDPNPSAEADVLHLNLNRSQTRRVYARNKTKQYFTTT